MTTQKLKNLVWQFYRKNKRDLPWRKQINPYRILVSEIMLQQTQVGRVIPKYREFLKQFPNFSVLAKASNGDVLRVWNGLGYNRRALYLKRTAETVVKEYGGKLPSSIDDLIKLPGVGKNTAGAIMAYGHNKPVVFIETNIRRVFIHHFFSGKENVSDAQLMPLIEKTVDMAKAREWYWALMDYGSFLASTVENPNRRSKHYSKQSKFEGSLRQVRGKVLKYLLQAGKVNLNDVKKYINDDRLEVVLNQLIAEGFVKIKSQAIFFTKNK